MKGVLKIVLWIIVTIVAFQIFFTLLGVFTLLAWVLLGLAIVAFLLYMFVPGIFDKPAPKTETETQPIKLYDSINGSTTLFASKPTLMQLANPDAAATTIGNLSLPNDITIKVVEDDGSEVLKIKLTSGAEKGKVGWVERSAVQGYKKMAAQ